jgi:hypothetical protein
VCEPGESCMTCPADCGGTCICGDLVCAGGENCSTCGVDCGGCTSCGDGICDPTEGETCSGCTFDCTCGAVSCDAAYTCAESCGADTFCVLTCYESACAVGQQQAYPIIQCAYGACASSCTGGLGDPLCSGCLMSSCPALFSCGTSC